MVIHALVALSLMLIQLMYPSAVFSQESWVRQETPVDHNLTNLDFVDRSHGWGVGVYGTVLCTTDGGESWEVQQPGTSTHLMGVDFVDIHSGWVIGSSLDEKFIARTQDGGKTWTRQNLDFLHPNEQPQAIAFLDSQVGWAVGYITVIHTVDGGMNWVRQQPPPRSAWGEVRDMQFVDGQEGWLVGGEGWGFGLFSYFAQTTDAGSTWQDRQNRLDVFLPRVVLAGTGLTDVDFVDREHGWTVGDYGLILHTGDGGDTWEIQDSGTTEWLSGVDFVNEREGWIVGYVGPWKDVRGQILHTEDGGQHWTGETIKGEPEIPGLHKVQFLDENTGWCVGVDGTVLRYVPDHPTSVEEPVSGDLPDAYALFPNSPNPFNAETMIRYTLPEQGHVRLSVYSALGQEIRRLVDFYQPAGTYILIWDGRDGDGQEVPSGVYLYRLSVNTGIYSETRRMVVLR